MRPATPLPPLPAYTHLHPTTTNHRDHSPDGNQLSVVGDEGGGGGEGTREEEEGKREEKEKDDIYQVMLNVWRGKGKGEVMGLEISKGEKEKDNVSEGDR